MPMVLSSASRYWLLRDPRVPELLAQLLDRLVGVQRDEGRVRGPQLPRQRLVDREVLLAERQVERLGVFEVFAREELERELFVLADLAREN